jgi:hypothetical protein
MHHRSSRPARSLASHRSSRARRGGQALLLAVLLMVFAALIGSTFITVVALNMDQTATQEERQAAAGAANAGLQVTNYQLNANGTSWRPEQVSPPPAPGDPEYNFYWTAQDIAQGYARTTPHPTVDLDGDGLTWAANSDYDDDWLALEAAKATGAPVFVKFPDPRLEQTIGSHIYMTEVRPATTADGADKDGMLKITSVGLSADDPNIYVKNIAYKGTETRGGAFAWGLFHTNWNYRKNTTVATEEASGAVLPVGTSTITVNDATGITPGRVLVLQQGSVYEYVICSSVSGNTITFRAPTRVGFNVAAVGGPVSVRAATILMNDLVGADGALESPAIPKQFDADGESATSAWEYTLPQARTTNWGYYFNTDVLLQAKSNLVLNAGQEMSVSGIIHDQVTAVPSPTPLPVQTRARVVSADDGNTERIMPTSYGVTQVGSVATPPQTRVKDNPDPTNDSFDATNIQRTVRPQVPPDLTKFTKLLDMTKYAPGGPIGLGPGVYINNGEDVEKVLDGTLRTLSNSDLHRFWQGKSFPSLNNAGNAGVPPVPGPNTAVPSGSILFRLAYRHLAPPADGYTYPMTSGSLEQIGRRGWVSPFEFIPRGAQVELNGDTIIVTLDDLSDTTPDLPDPNKAWPWAVDTTIVPTPLPKAYRMTINTLNNTRTVGGPGITRTVTAPATQPFNGVIFAEGNIRVRGTSGSRPITIVSMNNIYIEGNLRQGSTAGRIALLAKRNVVLNPTQFISRVDGAQERAVALRAYTGANAVTTASGTGAVSDPLVISSTEGTAAFRIGDLVRVGSVQAWSRIEDMSANALVLNPPLGTAPTAGTPVRLLCDPNVVRGNTAPFPASTANTALASTDPMAPITSNRTIGDVFQVTEHFYRLGGNQLTDTLVRDVKLDNIPTLPSAGSGGSYLLNARMVGERKEAISLKFAGRETPPAGTEQDMDLPADYRIGAREDDDNNTRGEPAEDQFRATSSNTVFPFTVDLRDANASGSREVDSVETIAQLKSTFNSAQLKKWRLDDPDSFGGLPSGVNDDGAIAARYLARIGSNSGVADNILAPQGASTPLRQSIYTNDEVAKIPLTVSVGLHWQSNLQTFFGTSGAAFIGCIGSNPESLRDAPNYENLETTRSDFYWYNNGNSGNRDAQQWLRWITRTIPVPRTNDAITPGFQNAVVFQRDPATDAVLPPLRIGAMKLERDDFLTGATRAYDPIEVNIQATIFAQEGSWFVIPLPQQHRTDENSSGANDASERAKATRMNRMNYRITVTGSIVQNYAPSGLEDYDQEHSPDDRRVGAMAHWIDAYSYPSQVEPNGSNPRGLNWMTIQYNTAGLLPVNSGLQLPPSPDIATIS